MHNVNEWLEKEFIKAANPERALVMKAYMKDQFEFYGIPSGERKHLTRNLWQLYRDEVKRQWNPIAKEAWGQEEREWQYVAMDILGRIEKKLLPEDLPFIEYLITHRSWWDTVDFLASHAVGQILSNDKSIRRKTARNFMKSDNMWLQRTALIFQLRYGERTDEELLFEVVDFLGGGKEFFINKAIGWSLRQYSKFRPHAVSGYLEMNRKKLSGLSIREASKYLAG